jgi:hypothetical protein
MEEWQVSKFHWFTGFKVRAEAEAISELRR